MYLCDMKTLVILLCIFFFYSCDRSRCDLQLEFCSGKIDTLYNCSCSTDISTYKEAVPIFRYADGSGIAEKLNVCEVTIIRRLDSKTK